MNPRAFLIWFVAPAVVALTACMPPLEHNGDFDSYKSKPIRHGRFDY